MHKSSLVDAPIIENCMLTLECEVVESHEYKNFINFIAEIRGRVVEEALMDGEAMICKNLNPILFVGDEHGRSYRYLSQGTNP